MSYHKIQDDLREDASSPATTLFSPISLNTKETEGLYDHPDGTSSETDVDLGRSGSGSSETSSVLGLKLGNLRGILNSHSHTSTGRRRNWWGLWSTSGWKSWMESLQSANVLLVGSIMANVVLLIIAGALCLRMAGPRLEAAPHHYEYQQQQQNSHPPDELVYTPAEDILELRVENYYIGLPFGPNFPMSKHQGWPDDEKDKLWMKYWDGNHMRVNRSIAEKLPHLSLHAPIKGHQDEYLMGIMAFHHLHCLSALRKYIYPKRYNASIVDETTGLVDYEKWHHLDHCIEILRQSIECRPDTTARTFRWHPGGRMIPHEWVTHTCRNFDALQSWASEATVSVSTRTHVVDGVIVDDEGKPFPEEFEEIRNKKPEGWAYTVDDL